LLHFFFLIILTTLTFTEIEAQDSCPTSGTYGRDVERVFFIQVVEGLKDVNQNDFAVDAFMVWEPFENTRAYWNPLATTWKLSPVCYFNCIKRDSTRNCIRGVQNYKDQGSGIRATVYTLNQSYYDNIRSMLRLESYEREALRSDLKTWGTCSGTRCDYLLDRWQELYNRYKNNVNNGNGEVPSTIVTANSPPNQPSLISPRDFAAFTDQKPRLCAKENGDHDSGDYVTGFFFEIYESAQLWNSGWTGSSCVPTATLDYHTFKWRAKVKDIHGKESVWSESWHFSVREGEEEPSNKLDDKERSLLNQGLCSPSVLDNFLKDSPLVGKGLIFMNEGREYNVDPRFIVAIAAAESSLGKNLCGSYNAWGEMEKINDIYVGRNFASWANAIDYVSSHVGEYYLPRGQTNIPSFVIKSKESPEGTCTSHCWCAGGCEHWIGNVEDAYEYMGGDPHTNNLTFSACNSNGNEKEGPSGYTFCAKEDQRCSFSGTKDVAYGAEGKFNYKHNISGGIDCGNETFGDPNYLVEKACFIRVADVEPKKSNCDGKEGVYLYEHINNKGRCSKFTSDSPNPDNWYIGNDSASSIRLVGDWRARVYEDAEYKGSVSTFTRDDPDFRNNFIRHDRASSIRVEREDSGNGDEKEGPPGYTFCAKEDQRCSFSGTKDVAYGAEGKFNYKYNITGGIDCDNETFGDPNYLVEKACFIRDADGGGNGDVTSATELAIRTLSREKNIRIYEIDVVSAKDVDYPDSCLGCAEPGELCLQVITSGYTIILRHEQLGPYGGTIYEYEYHIGKGNSLIRLCREDQIMVDIYPTPEPPHSENDDDSSDITSATEIAIKTLSNDKAISTGEIKVISTKEVVFPNSCLGCAKPGEFCSQVITLGFIIILRHEQLGPYGGTIYEYEYHIGDHKNSIRLCREDQIMIDIWPEPTAQHSNDDGLPTVTALYHTNCRQGPGLDYSIVGILLAHQKAEVLA